MAARAHQRILPTTSMSLALVVVVSGCATRLELSDEVLNVRDSLDKESALEIVASHIVEDSTQKGVCASITYATGVPDPAKLVRLDGSTVVFQGAKLEYEGNKTTELGAYKETRAVYSRQDAIFEIDLTQLDVIEVDVPEPMFTYSCHGFQDGATVKLMEDGLRSLFIQVNAAREDELIAALSNLSPDAKLRSRR